MIGSLIRKKAHQFTPTARKENLIFPYVGLQPYTEAEREYFFGRAQDSETIAANLITAKLTLLYGASGVGKTSVLEAGVVSLIRTMPDFFVVTFRTWQDSTFQLLLKDKILRTIFETTGKPIDIDIRLPLDEFLVRAAQLTGRTFLIIFDQFEEYFLYHQTMDPFEEQFARAVNRTDLKANFLLSLREDSLAQLDRFETRIPNLMSNFLRLEHLNRGGAVDAIRKPLNVYNAKYPDAPPITIEDALVDELIIQVQTGRVTLGPAGQGDVSITSASEVRIETAFLQMVLRRLWDEEISSYSFTETGAKGLRPLILRLATLEELGGVKRIVRKHLDNLMSKLSAPEREICSEFFDRLVTPSGTKISQSAEDLLSYVGHPAGDVADILKKLADARVLRPVKPTIGPPQSTHYEIFHDVLAPAILDWRRRYIEKQNSKKKTKLIRQALFKYYLRNRVYFTVDLIFFILAPVLAVWIRLESFDAIRGIAYGNRYLEAIAFYTLISLIVRWTIFIPSKLYARDWRNIGLYEFFQVFRAITMSGVLMFLILVGVLRPFIPLYSKFPMSIPLLDFLLVLLLVSSSRVAPSIISQLWRQKYEKSSISTKRVIIFGASTTGQMIAKEMQSNPSLGLNPVLFFDNDPRKQHILIHGVPVLGDWTKLEKLVKKYSIQQAVIAMPSASGKTLSELKDACRELNLPMKFVPGLSELLGGNVTVSQLRPVEIYDIIGHTPIYMDMTQVARMLKGKKVLVTGAGGSIGSELCRQITLNEPMQLVLLGHGENSISVITNELHRSYAKVQFVPVIADIRDPNRIYAVFSELRPDVVFHAAAHKNVPLMEVNEEDAVTNNVLGTRNVLDACVTHGVMRFVLLSTNTAVNPEGIMGATKRVAELLVQQRAALIGRAYVAVRFGNVLSPRGSIVSLFKEQIARGGPLTITHPDTRRYLMSAPEAVQLILLAATLGKGGEIFALDFGDPIKIMNLARELIRLSGLEDNDIEVQFIGLRPGEKLFEEPFTSGEEYTSTRHEKIFMVEKPLGVLDHVDDLIQAAQENDSDKIRKLLHIIVPEYVSRSAASPRPMD